MTGIGHNRGPALSGGLGWQKHCWSKARAELLPTLPIEVIRTRLKRAKELGLDYKAYASVRAKTGHDIVALLFSTNALRVLRAGQDLPEEQHRKLKDLVGCERLLAVSSPLVPLEVKSRIEAQGIDITTAIAAPTIAQNYGQTRDALRAALTPNKLPGDKVVVIGDTMLEATWADTARLGAYIPSETYFAGAPL
ncbi:hypothetical protein ACFE33_13075 [Falsihalocynthiibacter sp. SS001]|uniref:hypothetical protein n=1 Tax=Falsihalocynthiibacter sp. SS001 TaxID=3349698 RepID=UPI0036D33E39